MSSRPFCVLSCNKYTKQTVRIVDFGDADPEERIKKMNHGECILCGPCSHVEIGDWSTYYTIHTRHETRREAIIEACDMTEREPNKYKFIKPTRD